MRFFSSSCSSVTEPCDGWRSAFSGHVRIKKLPVVETCEYAGRAEMSGFMRIHTYEAHFWMDHIGRVDGGPRAIVFAEGYYGCLTLCENIYDGAPPSRLDLWPFRARARARDTGRTACSLAQGNIATATGETKTSITDSISIQKWVCVQNRARRTRRKLARIVAAGSCARITTNGAVGKSKDRSERWCGAANAFRRDWMCA
jgi:hypothetical protein